MDVFLTNQKKLAAAVGTTSQHLSYIKKGTQGVSDSLAAKLEEVTGIKRVMWAGASKKPVHLKSALDRFFSGEKDREHLALTGMAVKASHGQKQSARRLSR